MPELPEVEITARLIGDAIAGAEIESALTPGINALRSFDPPLSSIEGRRLTGITRRGKLFVVGVEDELSLLIHLMSAGRLQLFDSRASLRDRTSRLLLRLTDEQAERGADLAAVFEKPGRAQDQASDADSSDSDSSAAEPAAEGSSAEGSNS